MKLNIVECKGFTKDDAFKNLSFNPNRSSVKGANATSAWTKAGKPIPGTNEFKRFAIEQLENKTHNEAGTGLHIVLEVPVMDTRKRPYTIVNKPIKEKRHWEFIYQVREDDLSIDELPEMIADENGNYVEGENNTEINIANVGKVVFEAKDKVTAIEEAKKLTSLNRRSYTIIPVKVPDLVPVSAYCVYTPSQGTKQGTFIAFGYSE